MKHPLTNGAGNFLEFKYFEYDPAVREQFIDMYFEPVVPSHKRGHAARADQSKEAKRLMIRKALGK